MPDVVKGMVDACAAARRAAVEARQTLQRAITIVGNEMTKWRGISRHGTAAALGEERQWFVVLVTALGKAEDDLRAVESALQRVASADTIPEALGEIGENADQLRNVHGQLSSQVTHVEAGAGRVREFLDTYDVKEVVMAILDIAATKLTEARDEAGRALDVTAAGEQEITA